MHGCFILKTVVPCQSPVRGSPIIQDGKPVGAATHVPVNDPTGGYGSIDEHILDTAAKIIYKSNYPLSFYCCMCYNSVLLTVLKPYNSLKHYAPQEICAVHLCVAVRYTERRAPD